MTYVMSDLHGMYEKFSDMLEKIGFSEQDELYILGDVFDRGPQPVHILLDIMNRPNVTLLLGNHELMGLDVLRALCVDITEQNAEERLTSDLLKQLNDWVQDGGLTTLTQFRELPVDKRRDVLDYLDDCPLYTAVEIGEKIYIMTHAGLGNFSVFKKLSEYEPWELTCIPPDFEAQCFPDPNICLVFGHLPTKAIWGQWLIYRYKNNIGIDCGASFSGCLACLCLETDEEFYV